MTNAIHTQAKPISFTLNGREMRIVSGSKWVVSEGSDYTQVCLDKPGHELDGLTIAMDWSQGFVRPSRKAERVAYIIEDADILAMHAEDFVGA